MSVSVHTYPPNGCVIGAQTADNIWVFFLCLPSMFLSSYSETIRRGPVICVLLLNCGFGKWVGTYFNIFMSVCWVGIIFD